MAEQVRIQGLTELRQALLRELPESLQGKALQGALAAASRPIVAAARTGVPQRTGRLRKAIYSFRARVSTRVREVRYISVRSGKKFGNRDAFYWRWIEFGRGAIKAKRSMGNSKKGFFGREVRAVPAKPFLRPAFEANKLRSIEIFRQQLIPQIQKVAARARSRALRKFRRGVLGI